MPLYGSQLWDFDSNDCELFYTAWRKAIRKLLFLSSRSHCNILSSIVDCPDFAHSAIHSSNICVSTYARLALEGSASTFCRNLTFMFHKYQFERVLMKDSECQCINNVNMGADIKILAGFIKDFILWRDDLRFWRWEQRPGDNKRTVL